MDTVNRGRFAPTPSGLMHIGNAWTALLAWLQIRSTGGSFVLRIEDIDRYRSRPEWMERIIDDLRWLGLDWDEGPDVGGPYAPYEQNAREDLYKEAIEILQRSGQLYPCYCSRAELAAVASAPHGLSSEGPIYPGTCRKLTPEERAAKQKTKTPSYRFAVPVQNEIITFDDAVMGPQRYRPGASGDFIVWRADGIFAYQLAVVVDDASMRITDVLRGVDLLDSTTRQLLLYRALGLNPPRFAHVPLIYGPDGERLSKRHGDVTIAGMRAAGASPEQIVGWLAYLGNLTDRPEPVRATDLIPGFSLDRLPREPVVLSEAMLRELTNGRP